MVSHHPAKFGGHRHCSSGDMFLVVQEQYSACPRLNLPPLFISKVRHMPGSHTRNFRTQRQYLPVCPMKDSHFGHTSTRTTHRNSLKNVCQTVQK